MIDNVVIFGDSFNYGHGCKDRMFYYDKKTEQMVGEKPPEGKPSAYCWGSLLQQKYPDIKVYNFAGPGRSNQQIFRDFLSYSEKDSSDGTKTLMFFQLTNPDRIEICNHDIEKPTASYVLSMAGEHHNEMMKPAIQSYIKYLYHPSIGENVGFMTLLGAYTLAKIKKYNYYWSCSKIAYSRSTYDFLYSFDHLRKHAVVDVRNFDRVSIGHKFKSPDNHVNELGHQAYFDRIIDSIIKQYL